MKTYRLYYNRERDWPQIWSIDEGTQDTEINVLDYIIEGCRVESKSLTLRDKQKPAIKGKRAPFAWQIVTGRLRVENGVAIFYR